MSIVFYILAGLTLSGAVVSMALRNPVHCALCLVVTFVGLAGIYLGLGAQFLGLAQVLVYVGAVAILLVFVLLLTRSEEGEMPSRFHEDWRLALVAGGAVTAVLIAAVVMSGLPVPEGPREGPRVEDIGHALMAEFVLPLQVVGVLLTAALIGAAIIALQERGEGSPGQGPRPR